MRVQPTDMPVLWLLLLLHGALIVALPVGAMVLAPVVRRLVRLGSLPPPAPPFLLLFLALVEYGFLVRARRVWGRIRGARTGE